MSECVVIPWKPGCAHRERILPWVIDWWERTGRTVVLGECSGPWSKAVAVADALERVDADVLIVADADVILADPTAVDAAVAGLGTRQWAVPHRQVWRWNEAATEQIMAGVDPAPGQMDQAPYRGVPGGGITVLTLAQYLDVPLDPRFVGWGHEDEAHGIALRKLAGPRWWGETDLWHLWHPPQERRNRSQGSVENKQLCTRYRMGNRRQVRMIVEESKRAHREVLHHSGHAPAGD